MKIKTAELQRGALDWAVAQCAHPEQYDYERGLVWVNAEELEQFRPSTDWSQGGPIIEREQFDLFCNREGQWLAAPQRGIEYMGSTPLIAAMRCYVAMKLGHSVDVPEQLLK